MLSINLLLYSLAESSNQIFYSELFQITHEGMRYIARGCPLLDSLVLNKLARMKDESLYFFTK